MSDLPTGTVTFLFTDIEGSARLWSERRVAMDGALERHDEILRTAMDGNGGFVFATGGDSFAAAFQTTQQALTAAVQAQLGLAAEAWGEAPLRVRMGIHTGEAEERGDDYFGPVVNESARLMAAGHGGQVLVSETAQRIAADRLPDDVVLLDLGEHRLKDVDHPIAVYQVTHPDLALEFPALRGSVKTRNNLPSQLTSFVGRERELNELQKLLETNRLVTLTGAGGSGKTRLAIELASRQLESHPDGVWFVDLAAVDDPKVIRAAVAATLGVSDVPGQKILDRLVDRLSDEETLLILDNCEHLVAAAASLAGEVLKRTESLVVVATSREPLGVSGESGYPVPTLADAAGDRDQFTAEGPAVRLFVDRASLARPGLHLSPDDVVVVASICHRLDGLPLALELAAARMSILTPGELLDRLDDRFSVLVGGARDRLPRQQTLAATIDWSYELLTKEEQDLFARLSIFSGGFTLDAAEAICAGDDVHSDRMLDLVSGLVDKSLVVSEHGRAGSRFGLLETMREYSAAKLPPSEIEDLRATHAGYFRRLVVDSFEEISGADGVAWLDRLEDEWPNIRRALAWQLDNPTRDGLLMAGSLYRFAFRRYYSPEVLAWLERFLDADTDVAPSAERARALLGMGTLSDQYVYFEEAIDYYRAHGTTGELANALNNAAVILMNAGDWESARPLNTEAVELARIAATPDQVAILLSNQANLALQLDRDPASAAALAEEALDWARQAQSPDVIMTMLLLLAEMRIEAGDLDGAEATHAEAVELDAALGDWHGEIGYTQLHSARLALARGDTDQAVADLAQNAVLFRRVFEQDDTQLSIAAQPLHLWAEVAIRLGQQRKAVTVLGAQAAWYETTNRRQDPAEQAVAEDTLSRARAGLDPEIFDQAWEDGTAMSGPEALDYAFDQLRSDT